MITLKNVSKSYNKDTFAVKNLDLEIKSGEIFGFLGPNGAGKTTTLKMITGILESDSGSILINNVDTVNDSLESKKQFGFVPDSPDMFLKLKGIEYLNFIGDMYDVSSADRKQRIKRIAERFEMDKNLLNKISSYSHGMRQKIVIMGVLLHDPNVWILDEPLTGLDPKSSFILKEMMREHVAKGKTVLFSTHVMEVAEKLCDRVGIISKGELIFIGTIDELKNSTDRNDSLEKMFLEMTTNE